MKTYNNFNEMFSDNCNTGKSMCVFNRVSGCVRTINGEEFGTFTICPDTYYGTTCYVFWGASATNESNTGYIVYFANPSNSYLKKTPYNILKRRIESMFAKLPDIEVVERNASGEIYCSRQLTKEEAQNIAFEINDILWRDVKKDKKDWETCVDIARYWD